MCDQIRNCDNVKEIHLLCNAHLDPVWLWNREAGIAEAISTFRVAATFCEEYEGFVFNHNEALLYEWVEEYEPELFKRIQNLVKAGKWHIMGGWYLQPDCTMPSGESFIRQIEAGIQYFKEKFGVRPSTAINFDSFGHTRGLVQILKKWGYDSYVFMRPSKIIPERDFVWRGYDGSEVIGHCLCSAYGTQRGQAMQKIENDLIELDRNMEMIPWGIGNHGGGPSRIDIEKIQEYQQEHTEVKLIHSWCENYFEKLDKSNLKKVEESLLHCFIGCYTSMAKVKQLHRRLESELGLCEKMLAQSGVDYNAEELCKAEKSLLFSEFHDALPGTMIKQAEDDTLRYLQYGREIVSKYCMKAFFKMCEGQKAAKTGEIPVMVYNPHPYPVEQIIEVEFVLENQNWTENQVTLATVRDQEGIYMPTQNEKESSCLNLDWVKRIAFSAKLKPMCINRFDCKLRIEELPKRPIELIPENHTHIMIKNSHMEVWINKITGLLDRYCVDGRDYLKSESGKILVYADNEDPWAMKVDGYYDCIGAFQTVSSEEANAFNGYPNKDYKNVRVIENGSVRCIVQAVMKYSNSWAIITYSIPKEGKYVDLHIKIHSNDVNRMYKLQFDSNLKNNQFVGQTAFGREILQKEGKEMNFQKWCGLFAKDASFGVINRDTYGGSCIDNCIYISLMRTPVYSAHPIRDRELTDSDRNHDHIDMGIREFKYRLTTECEYIDADSEMFNQQPYVLSFFPAGILSNNDQKIYINNKHILLSSMKKNIDGKIAIRFFNTIDKKSVGDFVIGDKCFSLSMFPYEIKTYIYDGNNIKESVFLTEN